MNRSIRFALLATALACVGVATADDFNPPPWRGAPMSDFQQWEFKTDGPFPEISNNPFGQPAMTDVDEAQWLETKEGRDGVWCIGEEGKLVFHIPDAEEREMKKLIRIQITFFGDDFHFIGDPFHHGFVDLGNGWHGGWADYVRQCKPFDVYIFGPNDDDGLTHQDKLYVDELVVDAVCVPEPGMFAGLSTTGLGLVLRRRKR